MRPRHFSSSLPFMSCSFAWLDTQNLMRGLPPIYWCISSLRLSPNDTSTVRGYICKNYLIWAKLVEATESCTDNASYENLDPESSWFAFHWFLRWSSWWNKSSLDFPYSVEDVSSSRTFPSALLFPCRSVCPIVSLCPLYSILWLLWILPIFCLPHQFSGTVH